MNSHTHAQTQAHSKSFVFKSCYQNFQIGYTFFIIYSTHVIVAIIATAFAAATASFVSSFFSSPERNPRIVYIPLLILFNFTILLYPHPPHHSHSFISQRKKRMKMKTKYFVPKSSFYTIKNLCMFIYIKSELATHRVNEKCRSRERERKGVMRVSLFSLSRSHPLFISARASVSTLIYGITNNSTYIHNNIHRATKPNIAINIAGFGNGCCSCCFGSTFPDRVVVLYSEEKKFQAGIPMCAE